LHIQFEEKLAEFKSTEKALFFSSGYAANVGTISALVGKQDLILSDELNHSSILSGAKLSGAELIEYEHLSIDSLEQKLIEYRKDYKNALICTESVFSMDGDIADLKSIVEIAEKHDAWLLVDEAHSTGVFGGEGRGLVYKLGLTDKVHVQMGTCSKALGVEGGYIAGSTELIDFLIQRAKTFVYSTAPSIPAIAALMESLKICQAENWRREKLFKNVQLIRAFCSAQGLELIEGQSQIICLKMPSNEIALKWSGKLMELGVWVQAIRPPTVKTPRLRISVSALHDESNLKQLFEALNTFL
jgi:8-amino-7-oxononanoate synthase